MIVITGGGTGGHLAIARALAQELHKREIPAIYIGSLYGQDQMWFGQKLESSGLDSSLASKSSELFQECYFLNTSGVVNKKGFKKLASIYAQLRAMWGVRKIFARHGVQAVISVGGFSAGPASLAAIMLRKPLFIHEQNAIQGRLNSLLAPFAKAVFNSFHPPFPPYPIKQEALQSRRIRTEFQSIIFIGGSQGAKAINDLALQAAPKLLARGIRIIHQCGERDLDRVRQAYMELDSSLLESRESAELESKRLDSSSAQEPSSAPRLTLFSFDKDLIKHLDKADICIARAGASSIWENAALSLPTIYIPYPYAANNHQYHNASYFTRQGLGLMITEQELRKLDSSPKESLESALDLAKFFALLSQLESNLTEISTALSQTITTNGAELIITDIMQTLAGKQT
ncbi:UDP-N-acetylglucosamine--N-acetylmuramyl-(pentapeptide) pyrophosphoryl-undecaprenol N-acetylglucosamine transferase [Helicobacter canis]|uniref:UDP-N-acetylglucosamine--N-acetylmuramyl-(pentapeptide) pyrophosphoryl-undecaprenol N-acetylglucosamine transferase n=1 Tax=Helicobacter canis NCTC 12740 TaxID=1357399 RepID=V8CL35_9HELI|nr:UDP-N-acetylglucosamine--N-acetylmuramyl-(pentapeptide) pyrophosphoryl-undecaprenol N-acetylglucosamine transferase [Helicobacter canis]ETD27812.1 hypothetical protein HMPREF2087_00734 [Helicobacter canis NCTC 12740]